MIENEGSYEEWLLDLIMYFKTLVIRTQRTRQNVYSLNIIIKTVNYIVRLAFAYYGCLVSRKEKIYLCKFTRAMVIMVCMQVGLDYIMNFGGLVRIKILENMFYLVNHVNFICQYKKIQLLSAYLLYISI